MARSHAQTSVSPATTSELHPQLAMSSLPTNDPLSDVLRKVKLTGALFFCVDATSPWGVVVPHASKFGAIILPRAQHIVSYHIVLEGSGYASVPGLAPQRFAAGDVIVFPHADPYAMLSKPCQPPELSVDETLQFFRDMAAGRLPFVIAEGGGGSDRAKFVCGFLGCDARPFNPLLATLPRLLQIRRPPDEKSDLLDRLIDLTLAEAQSSRAGGECIRLGLSELIFIEVVRRYLEGLGTGEVGWLAGLRDPSVGRALALLHEGPGFAWTLNDLARQTGLSRSVLAERFAHLVGYPPMQYLAQWRMQMAARMLCDGTAKIAAVGEAVGYASEAAFSRTFKKTTGVSPAAWRARVLKPGT
jgi:AraC-like DNA-binding protein